MTNSHTGVDLEKVFHDRPKANQAFGSLTRGSEMLPCDEYLERLANLVERAKQFAKPLPSGKLEVEGNSVAGVVTSNFITPRRPILQTEDGVLELDFFIYAPPDNHDMSINASWYLPGQGRPKLVQQAYLSMRNFNDQIAAYEEDAPQVLGQLEEALGIYEQASTGTISSA